MATINYLHDLGFEYQLDRLKPKNINIDLAPRLFLNCPDSVKSIGKQLISNGWKFYVVDQNRGRCYYNHKIITIPSWAIHKSVEYKTWYICHEMAHTFTKGDSHGQKFMAKLIEICPENCVHFELEYKPRNAIAAGITSPLIDNLGF